jgi:hypothetical protein
MKIPSLAIAQKTVKYPANVAATKITSKRGDQKISKGKLKD